MQLERRACVLILDNGRLAGIFTERDILMKIAGRPLDLMHTPVSESMTPDPITLPADANVAFALSKMVLEGFRHIPLVDDAGNATAVVSMRNLIEYLGEIYSRELLTMPSDPNQARFRSREGA
jgi:CBS domain-containing protein